MYMKQVQIGSLAFTFDYVYGNMGSPSTTIYDDCVAPLVEALFQGFNATVLAYGQVEFTLIKIFHFVFALLTDFIYISYISRGPEKLI